ncbi:MAG: hypothetical protein ACYDD4_13405 [Acidimicrobiales bacterium]
MPEKGLFDGPATYVELDAVADAVFELELDETFPGIVNVTPGT